jgi:DNA-directed RNA polymerase specialized sigma24 family protein
MAQEASAANATRWSLIVRAQGSGADRRVALGELLSHYDRFVVWLIKHNGYPPDTTAEELKQEFLEGLLRRNDIDRLDRGRGSFRSWLSVAVRRFLLNEWDKWKASKAGRRGTSLAELEPNGPNEQSLPADDACMREFASHVVSRALSQQRRESRDLTRFDALARFLPGPQMDIVELASLGATLGMTPNALARAICLLRARFRELLREAIGDLLDLDRNPDPDLDPSAGSARPELAGRARAIDDELRELRRYFWS